MKKERIISRDKAIRSSNEEIFHRGGFNFEKEGIAGTFLKEH
jgi:hypothetical protein